MEVIVYRYGFYLRGKVRDLLPYLQQFTPEQPVAELLRLQLH